MKHLSWLVKRSAFRTIVLLASGALLLTVLFELAAFATWWPLRDLINLAEQGKQISVSNSSFLLLAGIFIVVIVLNLTLEYMKYFLQLKVQISMQNITSETQALQSIVPNSNLSRAEQVVQQRQMQKAGDAIVSSIFGMGPTFIRLTSLITLFFIFSYEFGVLPFAAVVATLSLVFFLLPVLVRLKESRQTDDALVETAAIKRIEEFPIKYILGQELEDATQVREANQLLFNSEKHRHAKWNSVFFFIILVPTVAKIIMVFLLIGLRATSSISTGGLMVLLAWTFMFDQFARDLQNITHTLISGKVSWDSFKRYFQVAHEAKGRAWEWPKEIRGNILIKDVSVAFGDGENRKDVLKNISLDIPVGTCLVIYSPSGGGKSTLLRLLQGACEFTGSILVDGVELRDIDSVQYRRSYLSVVLQDLQLFRGTVYSNVAVSNSRATSEEVGQVMQSVGFNLAGGEQLSPDFEVKQFGDNLSGGQKQRLALARAILRDDAKIMLIDEPTSALDDINAERVINLFAQIARSRQKTVIIATHDQRFKRIPGFRIADLKDGGITLSMAA